MSQPKEHKIYLAEELKKEMLQHARREFPLEACGIIAGNAGGEAVRYYPASNDLKSPTRYNMDPQDLYHILVDIQEKVLEVWGIFHSHPVSPAFPSTTDLQQSHYPDAYYLIASFMDEDRPDLRAFLMNNHYIEEIELSWESA